ncbi:MAG: outer membrane beta-barrel protein [Prevotella sp.]|nr:outer membrane beta-barrel protein [Prevotella sp.]
MNKKVFLLAVLASISLNYALAQEKNQPRDSVRVIGKVADMLTSQPVFNVQCELMWAADSSLIDTLRTVTGDSNNKPVSFVMFHIKRPGRYILRMRKDGYETTDQMFEVKRFYKDEEIVNLDKPFYMQKERNVTLGEVVVKATKVKFYVNGDTLVYNADAFELAEGSMLDALIQQLPGVELKSGGDIEVNGKHVDALLLNGKDFFNTDRRQMLDHLPSYMVKKVKAYDRSSEQLCMAGLPDDGNKEFVMDVQLKKEYSIGWIANAEAGAGTDNRFLGRLFALRFTPNSRLSFFANANNVSDDRKPGQNGDWSPLRQATGIRSVYNAGFDYNIDEKEGYWTTSGNVRTSYTEDDAEQHMSSENFLTGGNTFGRAYSKRHADNFKVSTGHEFNLYRRDKVLSYLGLRPNFSYSRQHSHGESASAVFDDNMAEQWGKAWIDSIMVPNAGSLLLRHALNRTISQAKGNGHSLNTGVGANAVFRIPHNNRFVFNASGNIGYTDEKRYAYDHYQLDYPSCDTPTDRRNRYDLDTNRSLNYVGSIGARRTEIGCLQLSTDYIYSHANRETNRSLYLLHLLEDFDGELGTLPSADDLYRTLDTGNSNQAEYTDDIHRLRFGYDYNSSRHHSWNLIRQFHGNVEVRFERNQLDYQRGQLDTLFHRNTAFVQTDGDWRLFTRDQKKVFEVNFNTRISAPGMTYLLNIRDDSDPLRIVLSNPQLKNPQRYHLGTSYRRVLFGERLWNVSGSINLTPQSIAMATLYDKQTGIRTVTPQNVNGNWDAHLGGGYNTPLDHSRHLSLSTKTALDYYHSVDLISTTLAAPSRSIVGSYYANKTLSLTYSPNAKLQVKGFGNVHYQHSTSDRTDFETINVLDFDYGLTAQVELPWDLQLVTDLTMYSRRGYTDHAMNTNELVWNARLSKRFLHGNLISMLDGFDLLGNLSNIRHTINAQGRTETWNNVTPRYAMLHVVYRLNKQPKKKPYKQGAS